MYRSQKKHNPVVYLKNLICTSGSSGRFGTEYFNATVEYDPSEHAHSDTYDDTFSLLEDWAVDSPEYRKVVTNLTHANVCSEFFNIPSYFGMQNVTIHVIGTRKESCRLTVTFPCLDASRVDVDVEIFSHIALLFARFLESESATVHFNACFTFLRWEDMEEENLLYAEVDSD